MQDIYAFMLEIERRPAMFTGVKSITALRAYFNGYLSALWDNNIPIDERGPFNRQIHDWVAQKFGWSHSTAGWNNIILKEAGGDEAKAVDIFFELLKEFRQYEAGLNKS